MMLRAPVRALEEPMYALNFYSPMVADQLRSRRKTATIRLGDKSAKYKKGMVVQVLVGQRYGPRERIFDAVIDKVDVKSLAELSPREIEHDNPEIRRTEELASFLGQLYNREVTEEDQVTLIRFSEILSTPQSRRVRPAEPELELAPRLPDRRPEQLCVSQRRPAAFALDGKRRAESRAAAGTAKPHLPAARGAGRSDLRFRFVEVPLCMAATEAESHPVTERLAPLLPEPIGRLAHTTSLATVG